MSTFNDTLTVVAVNGLNYMMPQQTPTPPSTIQITMRLSSNNTNFTFSDEVANAAQYIYGAQFTLTVAPAVPTTPT